jgi:hypothetical protein
MDLREVGWVGMGWIDLVQERDQWMALVSTAMEPSSSIKCREILE